MTDLVCAIYAVFISICIYLFIYFHSFYVAPLHMTVISLLAMSVN